VHDVDEPKRWLDDALLHPDVRAAVIAKRLIGAHVPHAFLGPRPVAASQTARDSTPPQNTVFRPMAPVAASPKWRDSAARLI
jgi:hypothetical protein